MNNTSPSTPLPTLAKADLHVHQEATRYLDIVLAEREGREPYDWTTWRRQLAAEIPPGFERLKWIGSVNPVSLELDADDEMFVARFAALLRDHARQNAHYVEVRCGGDIVLRDGCIELFRQAEQKVRAEYPQLHAEVLAIVVDEGDPDAIERFADGCVRAASEGLAGIDFLYSPYNEESDWTRRYRLSERFAEAGLGVTAHAGEVSTANIAAAALMPGLTRIGHGVHAAADPELIQLLVDREITLECALTCNEFFGVLPVLPVRPELPEHPVRRLGEAGVRVTLATDNPIQLGTDIGKEYARAAEVGWTADELTELTRNAIRGSFTTPERKQKILNAINPVASTRTPDRD